MAAEEEAATNETPTCWRDWRRTIYKASTGRLAARVQWNVTLAVAMCGVVFVTQRRIFSYILLEAFCRPCNATHLDARQYFPNGTLDLSEKGNAKDENGIHSQRDPGAACARGQLIMYCSDNVTAVVAQNQLVSLGCLLLVGQLIYDFVDELKDMAHPKRARASAVIAMVLCFIGWAILESFYVEQMYDQVPDNNDGDFTKCWSHVYLEWELSVYTIWAMATRVFFVSVTGGSLLFIQRIYRKPKQEGRKGSKKSKKKKQQHRSSRPSHSSSSSPSSSRKSRAKRGAQDSHGSSASDASRGSSSSRHHRRAAPHDPPPATMADDDADVDQALTRASASRLRRRPPHKTRPTDSAGASTKPGNGSSSSTASLSLSSSSSSSGSESSSSSDTDTSGDDAIVSLVAGGGDQ